MRNRNLSVVVGLLVLWSCGTVFAARVIDVGNHQLLANTPNQVIQIFVTGNDPVPGVDFFIQVGDGGPEIGDYEGYDPETPGPAITNIDLKTGTIFAGVTDPVIEALSVPQFAMRQLAISQSGGVVTGSGLLATIYLDTTGFTSGTWDLKMAGLLDGTFNTSLLADVGLVITNGSITIVPEPAGVSLLLLTGALMARRVRHV